MSRIYHSLYLLFLAFGLSAQVSYTANDFVQPYGGSFHPSANIGEYTAFSEEQLAILAAGGKVGNGQAMGLGVKALRPGLFEDFLETAGYDARVSTFQFYEQLGMKDHTLIVGFPSLQHRDTTQYCPGIRSEMFANLYLPIWDDGANGTPYNEENYYAAYLYKTVSLYKDYVRFWEIWNEPGFDYTGGLGYLPPGAPGNWWDNNPDPCDYKLRAPIFNYIRILRISWEIIKAVDPDAYVVVSGTGYPSFLDAILRNTDNPADGSATADYPSKGGAYFDVMGFHAYPHFDGSLREWSDSLNDWIYYRHSDAAAEGIMRTRGIFQEVLDQYGYNGATYPEKLWMITEVNLPRKQFGDYIGSGEAQKNFVIKAMATAIKHNFLQLHFYKLAEDTDYDGAHFSFDLMGFYKRLNYNSGLFQEMNDLAIAHKTASDVLFGKIFDPVRSAALNLGDDIGGGAFKDEYGNFTYVLWAKTQTDLSESATAVYSFPSNLNISNLLKIKWDGSLTHEFTDSPSTAIALTATPVFLTERIFSANQYHACAPFKLELTAAVNGAVSWYWEIVAPSGFTATFTAQNPGMTLNFKGTYEVTLTAKNPAGKVIAKQTQRIYIGSAPSPDFSFESSGPIVHFKNLTPTGNYDFLWQFGDGASSAEPAPTHVYLQSGDYQVSLTASTEICGSTTVDSFLTIVSPGNSPLGFSANDAVPAFSGHFRPGTSWDYVPGWSDEQIANIAAGNPVEKAAGAGLRSLRTFIGESFFLENGYDAKLDLFRHYQDIGLSDNTFLLAFPSVQSRDSFYYCPDGRSTLFKDLYLDIWDNGENGTPVNDENPFALYVWNTVSQYKDYVKYWEVFNSPDFDLKGDKAWLPAGEPGNWWENNPDPCDYELRAPIFYYIRSLRIAYEVIHTLDPNAYVAISGIAYPSFLDAICRNTDNPQDGSAADPYPLKGGAYFDAVGFKSYPHFDGSTIYFDLDAGAFAYRRHSDAAVDGIARMKNNFQEVLKKYGYDGSVFPKKEWIISEANVPRKEFGDYFGTQGIQRNWMVKAWVESVKNEIRQLNIHKLAESETYSDAADAFQIMGLYQKITGLAPYQEVLCQEGVALKTCSDLLFGAKYDAEKTAALQLPEGTRGAAFKDAGGHFTYVLWAETKTDKSETANAIYSFPAGFGYSQLQKRVWDFSQTGQTTGIAAQDIELTGAPIFLSEEQNPLVPPIAFFKMNTQSACAGESVIFTDFSTGNPAYWKWSFPGGIPSSFIGKTPPEVTYIQSGDYSVSLLVKNVAGEHKVVFEKIISIQEVPSASFNVQMSGATIQFINTSQNAGSYEWCYGDGYCNHAFSPLYTYFQNGSYPVSLIASSNCGSDTASILINIDAAPTANFIAKFLGNCGDLLTQLVDQSYSSPTNWQWYFEGGSPASSTSQFPTTTFSTGGLKTITLIVSNENGADTLVRQVYIEGPISLEREIQLCYGSSFTGQVITQDTTIEQAFLTAYHGCDSLVTTHIEVVENIQTFQEISLCEGDWYHGFQIFSDTTLIETISIGGVCDSISSTSVQVFPRVEIFLTETIGQGEQLVVGAEVFTQTGQYELALQTIHGCDSLIHLNLTVLSEAAEIQSPSLDFQVFPNPFSTETSCAFELTSAERVSLEVFDLNGRLVHSLLSNVLLPAGNHRFTFPKEWQGAGVFLFRLRTERAAIWKKVASF